MESEASGSNKARILRYLAGELDAEETADFETWLKAAPSHQAEFEQVRHDWSPEAEAEPDDGLDADLEWNRLMRWTTPVSPVEPSPRPRPVPAPKPPPKPAPKPPPKPSPQPLPKPKAAVPPPAPPKATSRPNPLRAWLPYILTAGVVLVGLWLIVTGLRAVFRAGADERMTVVTAEAGEVRMLVLPDSSVVRLNSETTLQYPEVFADQARRVSLSGEAFFDIKNADTPFFIDTDIAEIRSREGAFNVWSRDEETRVAVQDGAIRVWNRERAVGEALILSMNEGAVAHTQNPTERMPEERIPAAFAWLDGVLVFHDTPLGEAVSEIERAYAVPIRIEAPELRFQPVTDSLDTTQIDTALAQLCRSLNCIVQSRSDGYVLTQ